MSEKEQMCPYSEERSPEIEITSRDPKKGLANQVGETLRIAGELGIPDKSELHRECIEWVRDDANWEQSIEKIMDQWEPKYLASSCAAYFFPDLYEEIKKAYRTNQLITSAEALDIFDDSDEVADIMNSFSDFIKKIGIPLVKLTHKWAIDYFGENS